MPLIRPTYRVATLPRKLEFDNEGKKKPWKSKSKKFWKKLEKLGISNNLNMFNSKNYIWQKKSII